MSEEKPFISAFKKGVERAREIERQSKEINHVIDDLRSQILSVTDNKVEIKIKLGFFPIGKLMMADIHVPLNMET